MLCLHRYPTDLPDLRPRYGDALTMLTPADLFEAITESYTGDATLALQNGRIWFDEESFDANDVLKRLVARETQSPPVKISDLLRTLGDENIGTQNLDECAITLNWSRKSGGKITFGTDQEIIPGVGTKRLGFVVWLDREAVATAMAKAADPETAP